MTRMTGCLFCRIANGELPARIVYEDDQCLAFEDIRPQAPVHLLVIPRRHITSLNQATAEDEPLLGRIVGVAARLAREKQIDGSGYRLVINTNGDGGQSVFHVHAHVLGGRFMAWPPG
jgi:histidine triad (HIT) family protein